MSSLLKRETFDGKWKYMAELSILPRNLLNLAEMVKLNPPGIL